MSLNVVATRQDVDELAISQALLAGGAIANSDIVLCEGHSTVRILARSDRPMTVRVLQAISNPNAGPVLIETASLASVVDPLTGEQVIFLKSTVFGVFMRIELVNTDVLPQTAFEISAYLLPEGGGGAAAAPVGGDGACGIVFCYLTFS